MSPAFDKHTDTDEYNIICRDQRRKREEMPLNNSKDYIACEDKYGAHNYHPLPVVLVKGKGCSVWDVEGKEYIDCLSGYSAVNQGHCHPRLVKAMQDQCEILTLTSRAFHNDKMAKFTKYMTELFNYDRVLPMNTGVEAGETAVKLARRWAYDVKGIPPNEARVIFANNNFWGRSIAACSSSSDPECYKGFGPYTPGFTLIPYDDAKALEAEFQKGNVAAFYVEPIQGEAGVVVPTPGYLTTCYALCKQYNVLFICDEIQTGLGRCGAMLACEEDGVRPDVVVLGKALSGGMMPVSCVLASEDIMLTIKPGQHGSTYGGNPLACTVAMEALNVIIEEKLCERSLELGEKMRERLTKLKEEHCPFIQEVRGRGLMTGIVIKPRSHTSAWNICLKMAAGGVLAKPTHDTIIRLSPPLVITDEEFEKCVSSIEKVLKTCV